MNWMKHYSKAGLDLRIQNVINDMGYFGVGLYRTLCERIECRGEGSYPRKQLVQELKSRRLNSRHINKLLDEYNLFFTSPEGTVSLSPLCPGNTKEKITPQEPVLPDEPTPYQPLVDDEPTSQQPSVHDEPTSQQPSVHDEPKPQQPSVHNEPTSQQPSVHDEPNPHGTSVQTSQGARVIKRDYKERDYKERIYNNTNLPEWILKRCEQSWYPYVAPLLHSEQAAWREVVCMLSGYGIQLMRHWKAGIEQFALHITAYGTGRQSKSINKPYQPFYLRFLNLRFGSVKVTFSTSNLTIPPAHPMPLVKRKFYPLNTKKTSQCPLSRNEAQRDVMRRKAPFPHNVLLPT